MTDIISPALVAIDADLGADREAVIRALAGRVVDSGRASDLEGLVADALAREAKADTGLPGGLAIPHCRSTAVTEPTLAAARLSAPVDFGAGDGPADLVFLIAAPDGADAAHMTLLTALARSLVRDEFVAALRAAPDAAAFVALVDEAIDPPADPAPTAASATAGAASDAAASERASDAPARPIIVGVTACPTGIAHTYMAADALTAAGERVGAEVVIETQGSSGTTPIPPETIAKAVAVVFAADVDVRDRGRFAGKPVIQVPVKRGIEEPDALLRRALAAADDPNAQRVETSGTPTPAATGERESGGAALKRWLLTGVSYMIPFVAGGGLLIALGFLLGGYNVTDHATDVVLQNTLWNLPEGGLGQYLGSVAFVIGATSMNFLIAALAGYIAFAMADRPGIAPGFTVGAVAALMGAGFLGGLVGGLLAGAVAAWLARRPVPRWLAGLMPVVIIPLVASIVASGLMLLVLGGPIAALTLALSDWLSSLSGAAAIGLGALLGTMMAFDLGGPVNKVAYAFAVAGLGAGSLDNQAPWAIMAAVMAAGMVPPLAMALATVIAPKLFSGVERENGKAAWLLGASFISEGAIPFAVADVFRVIPAAIVGAAVTGAMCMGFGVTSQAPHGGIFVFFAIGNLPMFIVSIIVGTVISALIVVALKRWVRRRPIVVEAAEPAVSVAA
jgi:PTS system fructose-specific IIC component